MGKSTAKSLHFKGGKASDTLTGGSQADKIKGKHGNDVLIGLGGGDTLTGGRGADSFRYLSFSDSRGAKLDLITDFDAREGDKVDLRPLGTATLQSSYNAGVATLQAVFTYDAATNRTTLSYYQGSSTPVFQVQFRGEVRYSAEAFLGIVRPVGPTEQADNLTGTSGNDTIDLLEGNDTYDGLAGNDTIRGGGGDDLLKGGDNSDTIFGGAGNDTIIGGRHGDNLHGGTGADRFVYQDREDSAPFLDSSPGIDRIYDFNSAEGDKIDLTALAPNGFYLGDSFRLDLFATGKGQIILTDSGDGTYLLKIFLPGDVREDMQIVLNTRVTASDFLGVENAPPLAPTEGYDNLAGTPGDDTIDLLGGDDTYDGLAGNDTIRGGAGNDLLRGGDNDDTIYGGAGNDTIIGGRHGDNLYGGTGADRFIYQDQPDSAPYLGPNSGVDRIHDFNSGEGDKIDLTALGSNGFYLGDSFRTDLFASGKGQIILSEDNGSYLLRIFLPGDRRDDMHIVLNTKVTASDFLGVENAPPPLPTEGYDDLIGTSGDDTIDLLGGSDVYDGLAGNDRISGDGGDDTLYGGIGNDDLDGGDHTDQLFGGDGDDTLFGGDFTTGSSADGADMLDGGAGDDQLNGWEGDDQLFGGAGNDLLNGSFGTDTLTGGAGADIFLYGSPVEGDDIILDFNRAEGDKIGFSGNDSNLNGRDDITGWWFAGDSYRPDLQSTGQGQIVVTANSDGTYTFSAYYSFSTTPDIQTIVNTRITAEDFLGVTDAPAPVGAMGLVF